jgi:inosine-uridine nucleoside N-ribohydrolase
VERKLIIDLDAGIGDAVAAVLAMLDPQLDVIAFTAAIGVVRGAFATRNLYAVVEQLDPPKWPRIGCVTGPTETPLVAGSRLDVLRSLHGPQGLGDCELPVAELHHRHESSRVLADFVKTHPQEITVLTLGPLTNIAAASERAAEFPDDLANLVCLAGSVTEGGDVTATSELNVFLDPEAAATVLGSRHSKTLVPLDISNRFILTFEAFERLTESGSRGALLLQKLVPYYFRTHHQYLGVEGVPLREVVALAAVSRPDLFKTQPMTVAVEEEGLLTRGMTVFDRRRVASRPNCLVATEVDIHGLLDYMRQLLD